MKGVVWCTTIKDGNEKLEEIIKDYMQCGITIQDKRSSALVGSYVRFSNGDSWQVRRANDSSKGVRCNISYIQRNISYDIYNVIIRTCMFNYPFSAIKLWGEGDLLIAERGMLE